MLVRAFGTGGSYEVRKRGGVIEAQWGGFDTNYALLQGEDAVETLLETKYTRNDYNFDSAKDLYALLEEEEE